MTIDAACNSWKIYAKMLIVSGSFADESCDAPGKHFKHTCLFLQALVQDAVLKMRRPAENGGMSGKGAEADDAAMLSADAIRSA